MPTEAASRLRKSKESERVLGRFLLLHNGPDSRFRPGGGLASTTGRIGHITELQVDVISRDYAAENKQMVVPAGLWGFWKKIVHRANDQGKVPMIRWEPTNPERTVEGVRIPVMHIIPENRHAELLDIERLYREKSENVTPSSPPVTATVRSYSKEDQVRRSPGKRRAR